MRTRTKKLLASLALLFVLALAVNACSAEDGGDSASATTQAAETSDTEASESNPPATTPEATDPPASDEPQAGETSGGDIATEEPEYQPADVSVWVGVLAGLVLIVAMIWMVTRAGSTEVDEESS